MLLATERETEPVALRIHDGLDGVIDRITVELIPVLGGRIGVRKRLCDEIEIVDLTTGLTRVDDVLIEDGLNRGLNIVLVDDVLGNHAAHEQ